MDIVFLSHSASKEKTLSVSFTRFYREDHGIFRCSAVVGRQWRTIKVVSLYGHHIVFRHSFTMLWKLIVSLVALLHPSRRESPVPWEASFPISDVGPQTIEDAELAHRALHGRHIGGDILVNEDHPSGDGIKNERFRWLGYPGKGIVPYVIDPSLNSIRNLILQAMGFYHRKTCVQFVPKNITHRDWIDLRFGRGCNSYVGRQGGRQIVNLGDGCHYLGTVIHELGHAIGFHHEHQRSDRDPYLTVYRNNVIAGFEFAFDKTNKTEEIILTPYDYNSIMHYGNYAFSKQPGKLLTMVAKNGQRLIEPYDKKDFSVNDVVAIKKLYKCR